MKYGEHTSQTIAKKLLAELAGKQRHNPSISLRKFAKQLGLNSGTLSGIISGRRLPPAGKMGQILNKLNLDPSERSLIVKQVELARKRKRGISNSARPADQMQLLHENTHFSIISEWEHFAILSVLNLDGDRPDCEWIAKRLGISNPRAKNAVENLLSAQLVEQDEFGKITRTAKEICTTSEVFSPALRKSHKEHLELAASKIESVELGKRAFHTHTFAVNPACLGLAKEAIHCFLRELSEILECAPKKEVYQLGVQLFPLTNSESVQLQEKK